MKPALIFDMDGTLVDNMSHHTAAWIEFFRRRGRTLDEKEFMLRTAGRHGREIMREWVRSDLSNAENDMLNAEKEAIYRELYAPHLKTVPGVEPLLAHAKASGLAIALATSATDDNIRFTLDGLELRRYFDAIVGAADVERGKPAPDAFLKAAALCGAAPEHCIVFEDALLGVQAARNAGMRAVALTTSLGPETFSDFDNVIATIANYGGLSIGDLLRPTFGRLSRADGDSSL